MRRSEEIVDPFEYVVREGTIPSHLLRKVENLPVAGKSSQPRPGASSVVCPPRDWTPTTVKDDAGVGKVGVFAKVAGRGGESLRRCKEIIDPYEFIVREGRIPSEHQHIVKDLSVAGKSSQPRPRASAVVCPPRNRTPTTVKDDASVGKVGIFAKVAGREEGESLRRSKEIIDPYEFIVRERRIRRELQHIVKDLPVAGKSSRRPGAFSVVFSPRDRTPTTVKDDAGVGKVGLAARASGEGSAAAAGSTESEISVESPCLVSSEGFSLDPPWNTRVPATEVVPVNDTAAKVHISESKKELAVSFVRKSPLSNTSDTVEADDRTLSRKRKADSLGEPMQQTDLGVLNRKEDSLDKSGTSHQNFAEKSNLDSRQNAAEQPAIAVEKGSGGSSSAEWNTSGKKEAAAISRRILPRSFSVSEPPISQSLTRGARIRDETVAANVDENLGVPEMETGNLVSFLGAVKMLSKRTDRGADPGSKDESLLAVARRAGYTFYSYNPKSRAA